MSPKRIVLLSILIMLTLSLTGYLGSAQTKYRGFLETGYGTFVEDKSGSEWQVETSHGLLFNHLFVGAGLGCSFYSVNNPDYDSDFVLPEGHDGIGIFTGMKKFTGVSVPVFLNVKGFLEKRKVSPTFDLKGGVTAGFVTGLFGEVGAGCRLEVLSKTAILLNGFYKYAYEPNNMVTDDSRYTQGTFSCLGMKVALEFSTTVLK